MKKTSSTIAPPSNDLLPEFRFDCKKARPSRSASRLQPGTRVVVPDPDAVGFSTTTQLVNDLLRGAIARAPFLADGQGPSEDHNRNHRSSQEQTAIPGSLICRVFSLAGGTLLEPAT